VVRSDRGNLSRPSVAKVFDYRHYVTQEMRELLSLGISEEVRALVLVGIHHEKQHQELLLTDIKYILGNNPLLPNYSDATIEHKSIEENATWVSIQEGIYEIGQEDQSQFHYDNELGRHKVYLHDFEIASTLVTNGEYLDFIENGGYKDFNLWHAEAWDWVKKNEITQPMYWHKTDGVWYHYTLNGLQKINRDSPLTHISYFEAFAYAQYKECRLPTEFEWESAQKHFNWGQRWEWTESAYLPYPNYKKPDGALGEYNGKFMVNQKVLRGGSIATPPEHTRATYRNFFPTNLRWQYTGIRLAK
jgi:ergothioneine biosynthesis protein EgtB